jgi:hypothetical protein
MTHAEIINALGGCAALGREFGRNTKSVHNWKSRGIPSKWRIEMVPLAKKRGVTLPGDFLTREMGL